MKRLFLPLKSNNYHPYLLRKPMLALYLVLLIILNMIFGALSLTYSSAAIDFTALYEKHNEERQKRGLSDLLINPFLIDSATNKAKAMLDNNCWSHYCPDGKSPWEFFDEAGYIYVYAGENLAEGFNDTNSVMTAWMDSPTHRANILNSKFTEVGIGYARGEFQGIRNNTVVVVHFGSRSAEGDPNPLDPNDPDVLRDGIEIYRPRSGDSFNSHDFDIMGAAPKAQLVEIYADDESLAEVPVESGIFAYRPNPEQFIEERSYILKAVGIVDGVRVVNSQPVSVVIDKTAPVISAADFALTQSASGYLLEARIADLFALKLVNLERELLHNRDDLWQVFLEDFDPIKARTLLFSGADAAGNAAELEVPTDVLLGNDRTALMSRGKEIDTLSPFLRFRDQANALNFTFLIFMSGLFGIDYIMLKRSGLTAESRTHSHLNLMLFLMLAIVVLLAGSSGEVLTGLTLK